jgi:hypothetical protein
VSQSREIVAESRTKLSETQNAGCSYRNEAVNNVTEVEILCRENAEKWRKAEDEVDWKYTSAKCHVTDRVQTIGTEIEKLLKEKENLLSIAKTLDERNASLVDEIRTERKQSTYFLDTAILKFRTVKDKVEQTLERAETHVHGNNIFTEEEYLDTNQTEKDLKELYSQKNETLLSNLKGELNRYQVFVPGADMFDLGCLRWKRLDLHFLAEWPHDVIYNVIHVAKQKIAALVRCSAICGAYGNAVFLWENPNDAPELLTDKIDEATYMTRSGENIVIFRRKSPYIRIFDEGGHWVKDAGITIGKRRTLKPWSGGVDQKQRYFLVDSTSSPRQLVVHIGGNKYSQIEFPYTRLTYCEPTKTFYACDDKRISRFKWSRDRMMPLCTGKHGVPKFLALDISCDEEVLYVVGIMEGHSEVRVYRVKEVDSAWMMDRVDLFGEYLQLRSESSHPRMSVSRDQLVIAHDIGISVFLLHNGPVY